MSVPVPTEAELRKLNETLGERIHDCSGSEPRFRLRGASPFLDLESCANSKLGVLVRGIRDYAIYMLDPEGHVISWNSGAESLTGYTGEEIIGQHFHVFFTNADRLANVQLRALRHAVREGKFEGEGWRVRKDGSQFWASVVIDPIHDKGGKLIGFAKVMRVTERRHMQELLDQAREQILQMQKMEAIGQLTGGIAHDFNNLLMVVIGNLEIMERNTGPKGSLARQERAIANAMRGARRAAALTQRLLAFSRRQPLDPKPVNLNKFIGPEVEFFRRTLGEKIQVETVEGARLWQIEVDVNQMEAALLNLAVNARDAMPNGGKVTIETSNAFIDEDYCHANPDALPGQYVLISVTDNGTGMTKEVVNHAFEPFFSTKSAGQGTGLGLSQVYGFIKQSGGYVKISSELREGTTVSIYLPRLLVSVEGAKQEEDGREPVQAQGGETILVVEDDEDVRAYLIEVLRDLDYRALRAHDSVSAFGFLEQIDIRIDMLLTDVVLPGMHGRDLARKAQGIRPGLKVLFMTGYSQDAIIHNGRLDPDVEMIQKPIAHDQLAARIRALLGSGPKRRKANTPLVWSEPAHC